MCGIAGIYGLNNNNEAAKVVQLMTDRMAHRGPDDQGVFVDENVALGHRRLSIIDLSSAGHQPMQSFDNRLELVFNGEIYNFQEVRKSITNYPFKTQSDSEVILAAYLNWGKNCVSKLNGMFAFAIWDKEKKELFIARDRLGIKPLYYYVSDHRVLFASEIRSLLASNLIPKKINTNAIHDYFTYQTVHAPETIIDNVKMLMPGHTMMVSEIGISISKYWDIVENRSSASKGKSYAEVCNDVKHLFEASVKRRLISDVPFGAFLSGGIDSSAVVGLMSQTQSSPVKTFNISFDESAMSESKYAKLIARKFNTDHHELKLRPAEFLKQLPDALKAVDHPSGDGPNSYIVSKVTRENGITMALSGLGGDELFAGYPVFNRMLSVMNQKWIWNLPLSLRIGAGSLIKKLKPGVTGIKLNQLLIAENVSVESIFPMSRQMGPASEINKLINLPAHPDKVEKIIANALLEADDLGTISKVSVAEITTYMQNVLLRDTDQMSMASALEVRVPFLDYTLVEYVMGIKDGFKKPTTPKKLLIDSLGDLLPDEIINRPKMGFSFPWKEWIKNELKDFCDERIQSLSKRSFIHGNYLLDRWKRFLAGDPAVRWPDIWICVVLEDWLIENNIEN